MFLEWVGMQSAVVFQGKKSRIKKKKVHANFTSTVLSFRKKCFWWSGLGFLSEWQLGGWDYIFGCVKLLLVGNVLGFCLPLKFRPVVFCFKGPQLVRNNSETTLKAKYLSISDHAAVVQHAWPPLSQIHRQPSEKISLSRDSWSSKNRISSSYFLFLSKDRVGASNLSRQEKAGERQILTTSLLLSTED